MITYVTDTHGLYWYLSANPKLGKFALKAFTEAESGNAKIVVSAVVLSEFFYMNRKLGSTLVYKKVHELLRNRPEYTLVPMNPDDILDFDIDSAVPEMHDRIIVGLARRLGATLITKDSQIIASNLVPVLW